MARFSDVRIAVPLVYAAITLAVIWMVFRYRPTGVQVAAVVLCTAFASTVLDGLLDGAVFAAGPPPLNEDNIGRPSEVIIALLVASFLTGSLLLMRIYDGPLRRIVPHPGRRLPDSLSQQPEPPPGLEAAAASQTATGAF